MQRTIYIRDTDLELWKRSQKCAKAAGMSHSTYIAAALELLGRCHVSTVKSLKITISLTR